MVGLMTLPLRIASALRTRPVRTAVVGLGLAIAISASGCRALSRGGLGGSSVIPSDYKVTDKDRNDGLPTASEAGL